MKYLQTCPPMAQSDFAHFSKELENRKTVSVDGMVLSTLLQLCYHLGLHKHELIQLKIGDVSKAGVIFDEILVNAATMPLSPYAKQLLQKYIQYLRKKGYRLTASHALFPYKFKAPFQAKTLHNQLEKGFSEYFSGNLSLVDVRKLGVCSYYDQLKDGGESPQRCLEKVAQFARISEKGVQDLIQDKIKPAGVKQNKLEDYMKQIEKMEHESLTWKQENQIQFDQLAVKINSDASINPKTQRALIGWLKRARNSENGVSTSFS